jgi:AraC-like DNA-binding protein
MLDDFRPPSPLRVADEAPALTEQPMKSYYCVKSAGTRRTVKPFLERVPRKMDASWSMLHRQLDAGIPFQWHHHPEFELTLTLNSRGQRFVGDHVGSYEEGDLVLVGPDLTHTWHSVSKYRDGPHIVLVLWFRPEWVQGLADQFVEFRPIAHMFGRANAGLVFSRDFSERARPLLENTFALSAPDERLLGVLNALTLLAKDQNTCSLASRSVAPSWSTTSRPRIDRVLECIHSKYMRGITVDELAGEAALSRSGLHRLFRDHIHMTISEYVMRLRIGAACALLSAEDKPIAHVSSEVGYGTMANFERQFYRLQKMTPREYRAQMREQKRLHRQAA